MKISPVLALLLAATSQPMGGQTCTPAPSGLVGWWPGDGDASDIVGGNDGTLQGAAAFAAAEVEQGFSFPNPPLTGFVNVPYGSNPVTPQITVAAWVNPASFQGTASAANRRPGGNNAGYTLELTGQADGSVYWQVFVNGGNSVAVSSSTSHLTANTWTHVAGTYDGTTSRVYLDGVEVGSAASTGSIDPTDVDMQIGRNIITGVLWDGLIDEVQIFDRALSAEELLAIVNAGGGGVCKVSPNPMSVDGHAGATSSNLNGVLESGETVMVAPSWQNRYSSSSLALTGVASALMGPAGPTYTIDANAADYGTVSTGASNDCFTATQSCYLMTISGSRPEPHWDATFTEALAGYSSAVVKSWALHVGESFVDAPMSGLFYPFIENLLHNGITGGCGGGSYCPDNSVSRAQMAVFLLKSKHGSAFVPPACAGVFGDVPCPSLFANWIEELAAEGITGGCGAGNYCPNNPVTRAQMAVFLLKAEHGSGYMPPACTGTFLDVTCPSTFANWIERLAAEQITGGCGGGNYCPGNPNTRGQMAVFLVKTFGLQLYGP